MTVKITEKKQKDGRHKLTGPGPGRLPAMLVSVRGELGLPIMQASEPICSIAATPQRACDSL